MLRRTGVAIATTVALAGTAHADWPAGGKFVSSVYNGTYGARLVQIQDLPGGGFYVFAAGKGSLATGYGVQRLTAAGDIAPGWPATCASLVLLSSSTPAWQGWAMDDSACFWRVGIDGGFGTGTRAIVLQPNATLKPVSGSWQVHTSSSTVTAAAPGLSGDMYLVALGNRVKRFTRAGVQVAGWPTNGVVAGGGAGAAALVPDGSGGVIWYNTSGYNSSGTLGAMHILATGVKDPAWPAAGLSLTTDPNMADQNEYGLFRPLIRSGSSHFIAAWTGPYSSTDKQILLQRFSMNGALDPNWPADGLLIAAAGNNEGATLVEDGSGGVYVLWYQGGVPVAAHVLASGGTSGSVPTSLLPAGASFVRPMYGFPSYPLAYIAADVTPDGRLMYAWDDPSQPGTPRIRVRWLLSDLTPDPSEPVDGRIIEPTNPGVDHTVSTVRAVHSDGLGGAYVAWQVVFFPPPSGPPSHDLWMTRIFSSAVLGAPPLAISSRPLLSLPRPNPASDAISFDVTLEDAGSVRIELLDISGRKLRTRIIEGTGARSLSFDDLANLRPGLYFLRASGSHGTSTRRVALNH